MIEKVGLIMYLAFNKQSSMANSVDYKGDGRVYLEGEFDFLAVAKAAIEMVELIQKEKLDD